MDYTMKKGQKKCEKYMYVSIHSLHATKLKRKEMLGLHVCVCKCYTMGSQSPPKELVNLACKTWLFL